MCSDCRETGERRKDFRHTKGGPEEITRHPKRKSKGNRWCKGKEGREHRYEQVVWYSYKRRDSAGKEYVQNTYRWICQGCGKVSWNKPAPVVPKHDHHFCVTKTGESGWGRSKREEVWEECCVCGRRGKTYSYLK